MQSISAKASSIVMPLRIIPLPTFRDLTFTPSTSPQISAAICRTCSSASGWFCRLGERLGFGPITTAPCSISCLIFASSSGRIVSSCGSTSMRYCVPCGSVILPSCTVMYFSITSAFM